MYGLNTLPNTGLVASGAAAGVAMQSLWMVLLVVTILTVLATAGRMVPLRQS